MKLHCPNDFVDVLPILVYFSDNVIQTDLVTLDPDVAKSFQLTQHKDAAVFDSNSFTPRQVTVIDTGKVLVMTQCG